MQHGEVKLIELLDYNFASLGRGPIDPPMIFEAHHEAESPFQCWLVHNVGGICLTKSVEELEAKKWGETCLFHPPFFAQNFRKIWAKIGGRGGWG